jgi:hypothetical protein
MQSSLISFFMPVYPGAPQLPNVPRLIPRLTATSLIDRPELSTSSTASRWNSGGYFAGRPIRASLHWVTAQNQVSKDRGQLEDAGGRVQESRLPASEIA